MQLLKFTAHVILYSVEFSQNIHQFTLRAHEGVLRAVLPLVFAVPVLLKNDLVALHGSLDRVLPGEVELILCIFPGIAHPLRRLAELLQLLRH